MAEHFNTKRSWFKLVAVVVILAFLFNEVSYALEPLSSRNNTSNIVPTTRMDPLAVVDIRGADIQVLTDEFSRMGLASDTKELTALAYASRLIGKILDTYGSRISADGLKSLLFRHISHVEFPRFRWERMTKEGGMYCLDFKTEEGEDARIRYFLEGDGSDMPEGASPVNIGGGRARLLYEGPEEEKLIWGKNVTAADIIEYHRSFLEGEGLEEETAAYKARELLVQVIEDTLEITSPELLKPLRDLCLLDRQEAAKRSHALEFRARLPEGRRYLPYQISNLVFKIKKTPAIKIEDAGYINDFVDRIRYIFAPGRGRAIDYEKRYSAEFTELLDDYSEYGKQGPFRRALEYNIGKKLSDDPVLFMAYVIGIYCGDVPKNILGNIYGDLWEEKYGLTEEQQNAMLAALNWAFEPLSILGSQVPDMDDVEKIEDRESVRDLIKHVISLREQHLAAIDEAAEEAAGAIRGVEIVQDAFLYYRSKVVEFFDELEKRALENGIIRGEQAVRILAALASINHGTNKATSIESALNGVTLACQSAAEDIESVPALAGILGEAEEALKAIRLSARSIAALSMKAMHTVKKDDDRYKEVTEEEIVAWGVEAMEAHARYKDGIARFKELNKTILENFDDMKKGTLQVFWHSVTRVELALDDRMDLMRGEISGEEFDLNDILKSLPEEIIPPDVLYRTGTGLGDHLEIRTLSTPAIVTGNRLAINSVICNLVANALKAAVADKGKDARVKISIKPGQKDTIEVNVEDNGPGIPAEKLKDMEQPFHTTGGSGIGLTETRLALKDHGGRLLIDPAGLIDSLFMPFDQDSRGVLRDHYDEIDEYLRVLRSVLEIMREGGPLAEGFHGKLFDTYKVLKQLLRERGSEDPLFHIMTNLVNAPLMSIRDYMEYGQRDIGKYQRMSENIEAVRNHFAYMLGREGSTCGGTIFTVSLPAVNAPLALPPRGSLENVFSYLCEAPEPLTAQQIADGIGISYDTLRYDLRGLREMHLFEEPVRGAGRDAVYFVPERVRKKHGQLSPVLSQFRGKSKLRPTKDLCRRIYAEEIKPILAKEAEPLVFDYGIRLELADKLFRVTGRGVDLGILFDEKTLEDQVVEFQKDGAHRFIADRVTYRMLKELLSAAALVFPEILNGAFTMFFANIKVTFGENGLRIEAGGADYELDHKDLEDGSIFLEQAMTSMGVVSVVKDDNFKWALSMLVKAPFMLRYGKDAAEISGLSWPEFVEYALDKLRGAEKMKAAKVGTPRPGHPGWGPGTPHIPQPPDETEESAALKIYKKYPLLSGFYPGTEEEAVKWLADNRKDLGDLSLIYLVMALASGGNLPEGANRQSWERSAAAYDLYLGSETLRGYVPVDLEATVRWLAESREDLGDVSLSYLIRALAVAGRLPKEANRQYWEVSAAAYELYLGSGRLQSYVPSELDETVRWLAANRKTLGDVSLSYLMRALAVAGKLPPGADRQEWDRSAAAYDLYLGSELLQSYAPKDAESTARWLAANRKELGNVSLSYLMRALTIAGRLPRGAEHMSWKMLAAAYDFYLASELLQGYTPRGMKKTFMWLIENRERLGGKSLIYLIQALGVAGRLPKGANKQYWERMAAAFDRAYKERDVIECELRRILEEGRGLGKYRTEAARMRGEFDPALLPNLKTGKPLSESYRRRILKFAYDLYGKDIFDGFKTARRAGPEHPGWGPGTPHITQPPDKGDEYPDRDPDDVDGNLVGTMRQILADKEVQKVKWWGNSLRWLRTFVEKYEEFGYLTPRQREVATSIIGKYLRSFMSSPASKRKGKRRRGGKGGISRLLSLILVTLSGFLAAPVRAAEDDIAIKGANLPWINYGYDIGEGTLGAQDGYHGGFSSAAANPELHARMSERQGNHVRVFLFNDLRSGVEFDASGYPTGFTAKVYQDMDALIGSAETNNVKLLPVLFDMTMADGVSTEGTTPVGEHPDLLTDPSKRTALVDLFRGFISTYAGEPSIYAWDIMNEPEVAHELTGIAYADLYDFVKECADMIHEENSLCAQPNPDLMVTVGSKSREDLMRMLGYWDAQEYLGGYTGILDVYQIHYYDVMGSDLGEPFTEEELLLLAGKPVIVGEIQPTDITAKLDLASGNDFLAAFFWDEERDQWPSSTESNMYTLSDEEYQEMLGWYPGITYTHYSSGFKSSKTLERPDYYGSLYYHYMDENHAGQGFGRIDGQVLASADSDGAVAYEYEYLDSRTYDVEVGGGQTQVTNGVRHLFVGFDAGGYDSITNAMSDAQAGDILIVKAGVYDLEGGEIRIKDGVRVFGGYAESGARNIEAAPTVVTNGFLSVFNNTSHTEINGLTIDNRESSSQRCIYTSGCSRDLVILNNRLLGKKNGGSAYGIVAVNGSRPVIFNNEICGADTNTPAFWGGGIYVVDGSDPLIENNFLHDMVGPAVTLSIFAGERPDAVIRNNVMWNNGDHQAAFAKAHIFLMKSGNVVVENNTICDGRDGIVCLDSTGAGISNNVFSGIRGLKILDKASSAVTNNVEDPLVDPAAGVYVSSIPGAGYSPSNVTADHNYMGCRKHCYAGADYQTDPSDPAFSGHIATYIYDASGALEGVDYDNGLYMTYYPDTGFLYQKIDTNGNAYVYHNVSGFKLKTHWRADGTISHWASPEDYDINKQSWYMNGTDLEVYTYYPSGNVKYKDLYSLSGGTWTWYAAAGYLDDPPWTWDDWKTRETTGAPETYQLPDKPERPEQEQPLVAFLRTVLAAGGLLMGMSMYGGGKRRPDASEVRKLIMKLSDPDELARLKAAKELKELPLEEYIMSNREIPEDLMIHLGYRMMPGEQENVQLACMPLVARLARVYPLDVKMEKEMLGMLNDADTALPLRRGALTVLTGSSYFTPELVVDTARALGRTLYKTEDKESGILAVKALGNLLRFPAIGGEGVGKDIFLILADIVENGSMNVVFYDEWGNLLGERRFSVSPAVRAECVRQVAVVFQKLMLYLNSEILRQRIVNRSTLMTARQSFESCYERVASLLEKENGEAPEKEVRLAAVLALKDMAASWSAFISKFILERALDDGGALPYPELFRRFVVRKIAPVVYGDSPEHLEEDKDIKLMLSDILVLFGYPGQISSRPLVSSVMPLVFDTDSRISEHAERIICEVEARDRSAVEDPVLNRIFAFCHRDMAQKRERPHPGWGPGTPHITQPPDGTDAPVEILVTEEHDGAYGWIKEKVGSGEWPDDCLLINFDYHHDVFNGTKYLGPGNWVRFLQEEKLIGSYCWAYSDERFSACPGHVDHLSNKTSGLPRTDKPVIITIDLDYLMPVKLDEPTKQQLDAEISRIVKALIFRGYDVKGVHISRSPMYVHPFLEEYAVGRIKQEFSSRFSAKGSRSFEGDKGWGPGTPHITQPADGTYEAGPVFTPAAKVREETRSLAREISPYLEKAEELVERLEPGYGLKEKTKQELHEIRELMMSVYFTVLNGSYAQLREQIDASASGLEKLLLAAIRDTWKLNLENDKYIFSVISGALKTNALFNAEKEELRKNLRRIRDVLTGLGGLTEVYTLHGPDSPYGLGEIYVPGADIREKDEYPYHFSGLIGQDRETAPEKAAEAPSGGKERTLFSRTLARLMLRWYRYRLEKERELLEELLKKTVRIPVETEDGTVYKEVPLKTANPPAFDRRFIRIRTRIQRIRSRVSVLLETARDAGEDTAPKGWGPGTPHITQPPDGREGKPATFPLAPEYLRSLYPVDEEITDMAQIYDRICLMEEGMVESGFLPRIGEVNIPACLNWEGSVTFRSGNMSLTCFKVDFHDGEDGSVKQALPEEYVFSIGRGKDIIGHGIIYRAPRSGKIRFRYSIHGGIGPRLKNGIDHRSKGYGKEALVLIMASALNGELFAEPVDTFAYSWYDSDGADGDLMKKMLRSAGYDEDLEFSMKTAGDEKDAAGWGPGAPHINQPPDTGDEYAENEARRLFGPGKWNIYRSLAGYDKILRAAGIGDELVRALQKGGVYADFGCGVGRAAVEAADFGARSGADIKVYGVDAVDWKRQDLKGVDVPGGKDFSWEEFSAARARQEKAGRYSFVRGNITDVSLPEKADTATSFFVLQYAKDPLRALLNIYNQMNAGGMFFGTVIVPRDTPAAEHYEELLNELSEKYGAFTTGLMPVYIDSPDALCFLLLLEKKEDQDADTDLVLASSEQRTVKVSGETFDIRSPDYIRKGWGPGTPHITQPPDADPARERRGTLMRAAQDATDFVRQHEQAFLAKGLLTSCESVFEVKRRLERSGQKAEMDLKIRVDKDYGKNVSYHVWLELKYVDEPGYLYTVELDPHAGGEPVIRRFAENDDTRPAGIVLAPGMDTYTGEYDRLFSTLISDIRRWYDVSAGVERRPRPGWGPGTPHITQPPDTRRESSSGKKRVKVGRLSVDVERIPLYLRSRNPIGFLAYRELPGEGRTRLFRRLDAETREWLRNTWFIDRMRAAAFGEAGEELISRSCRARLEGSRKRILRIAGRLGVTAHGVEEDKGGLYTLLEIILDGRITSSFRGALKEGDPSVVSGPHGPYYVVLNDGEDWQEGVNHTGYIVPAAEDKQHLLNGLFLASKEGLISREYAVRAAAKTMTYEEYESKLIAREKRESPDAGDSYAGSEEMSVEAEIGLPEVKAIENMHLRQGIVSNKLKYDKGVFLGTPVNHALKILRHMRGLDPDARVCDLGSGNGIFALLASRYFPSVTGIEWQEQLHRLAIDNRERLNADGFSGAVDLIKDNFLYQDLSKYDMLYFFYTTPKLYGNRRIFTEKIKEKLLSETGLKPGARLFVLGGPMIVENEKISFDVVELGGVSVSVYTRKEEEPPIAEDDLAALSGGKAQDFVDSVITQAYEARRRGQNIVLGLDTSWIPGMQASAIQCLLSRIERISREKGLDNIIFLREKGADLADVMSKELEKGLAPLSNVIILGEKNVLASGRFDPFRAKEGDKGAFFAEVEMPEAFPENGYIRLLEMLTISLDLAFGGSVPLDNPHMDIVPDGPRVVRFIPRAEPVEYEQLKEIYAAETRFITAA